MFDAEYFNKHVIDQIQEIGSGSSTCEIHLRDGSVYHVRKLGTAHAGYVLLEIFPPEGNTPESQEVRKKYPGQEVYYDRVALPYESITQVIVTAKVPKDKEPERIDEKALHISITNSSLQVNSPAATQVLAIAEPFAMEATKGKTNGNQINAQADERTGRQRGS